jgi:hypothetical protein
MVVGSVAWAAIPATDGTITACYNKSSGAMSVIDPSVSKCNAAQLQLQWNQRGPAGATGQAGTNGAPGSSVVNTPEPPGSNCAYGGTRFVVGDNPPTFACNADQGDSAKIAALVSRVDSLTADLQNETQTRTAMDAALSQTFSNAVTALNPDDLNALQADIQNEIASTQQELSTTQDAALQSALDRDSKMQQMISNLMKKLSDTAGALTQNPKG